MVHPEGLEPPTYCLEGNCSIQLSYGCVFVERMTRIELARPAWEAGVLPLNYTRTSIQPYYYITITPFLQGGKWKFFVTYPAENRFIPEIPQETPDIGGGDMNLATGGFPGRQWKLICNIPSTAAERFVPARKA